MFAPLNSGPGPRFPLSPPTPGRSYAGAAVRAVIILVVLVCALALLVIF